MEDFGNSQVLVNATDLCSSHEGDSLEGQSGVLIISPPSSWIRSILASLTTSLAPRRGIDLIVELLGLLAPRACPCPASRRAFGITEGRG